MTEIGDITQLLQRARDDRSNRREVLEELIPLVYSELKQLARSNRRRWRGQPDLGTTSLVHEAYVKLVHGPDTGPTRGQFFAVASKAMRSILVDNARYQTRKKRGGDALHVPVQEARLLSVERSRELLTLDDALTALEAHRADLAAVVECRTFGGLTVEETAEALEVSPATVKRRWVTAKTWLFRELEAGA